MKVVILGEPFGFPQGFATSSYVYLMAKGLVAAGAQVHVMPLNATEPAVNPLNTRVRGNVDGISWEYTTGVTTRSTNSLRLTWAKARSSIVSLWRLFDMRRRGLLDVVIYYGRHLLLASQYSSLCRLLHIPFVVDLVEWPPALAHRSMWYLAQAHKFSARVFQLADAVIVISAYLQARAREGTSQCKTHLPIHTMSILNDPQAWAGVQPVKRAKPYVVYCADINVYLADALFILAALSELDTPRPDLLIIGPASPDAANTIKEAARRAGLQDSVVMQTEYIPSGTLRSLYAGAEALLAPLHDDDRSRARFPFKIADYLLSGRPVVSCHVGEVARFLRDGETAFLCEPDSIQAFAFQIHEALTRADRDTIAMRGKHLAESEFDYRFQGVRLLNFLNGLVSHG